MLPSSSRRIHVVGAGVIGLTTAVRLAEDGYAVTVLTREPTAATVSAIAAAIWYPFLASPQERIDVWAAASFNVYAALRFARDAGIRMVEGLDGLRRATPDPAWSRLVPDFRRIAGPGLPPGWTEAFAATVPVVEMPIYLTYLESRLLAAGGRIERRAVARLADAAAGADVVVCCAGLGARELAGDALMRPVRGQVVRVAQVGLTRYLLDDGNPSGMTYIIPRRDDIVVGGTADEGQEDQTPDPQVAAAILARARQLEPRLAAATVVQHKVGLRPWRPEVRLETGRLPDGHPVVYNYGHGGSGVTLAWGCADEVALLIRQRIP